MAELAGRVSPRRALDRLADAIGIRAEDRHEQGATA